MPAIRIAAITGFTGVVMGAFGAHMLQGVLLNNGAVAIWQTAVLYQLIHAAASLWASEHRPCVVRLWAVGVVIFSGSLYVLALTKITWLGAITPIGGILFLIGWAMLFVPKKTT